MPAILRIFPYQTLASLSVCGPAEPYGQGAGRRGATSATRCRSHLSGWSLQNLQSVGECAYGVVEHQASDRHGQRQHDSLDKGVFHDRSLFLMYWAYPKRHNMKQ